VTKSLFSHLLSNSDTAIFPHHSPPPFSQTPTLSLSVSLSVSSLSNSLGSLERRDYHHGSELGACLNTTISTVRLVKKIIFNTKSRPTRATNGKAINVAGLNPLIVSTIRLLDWLASSFFASCGFFWAVSRVVMSCGGARRPHDDAAADVDDVDDADDDDDDDVRTKFLSLTLDHFRGEEGGGCKL
jgi:hypothetical protein